MLLFLLLTVPPLPYADQVAAAVSKHLPAPNAAGHAAADEATLHVSVDSSGVATKVEIQKSSGSPAFDAVAVRAVKAAPLPLPTDAKRRAEVFATGVALILREKPAKPTPLTKGIK
jgi:TonB family protein